MDAPSDAKGKVIDLGQRRAELSNLHEGVLYTSISFPDSIAKLGSGQGGPMQDKYSRAQVNGVYWWDAQQVQFKLSAVTREYYRELEKSNRSQAEIDPLVRMGYTRSWLMERKDGTIIMPRDFPRDYRAFVASDYLSLDALERVLCLAAIDLPSDVPFKSLEWRTHLPNGNAIRIVPYTVAHTP